MNKPVIACLGNCQSGAVRSVLQGMPGIRDQYDVVFTRKKTEFAALRPRLAAVIQQVTHGWDDFRLTKDDLPASVTLVRYPAALLSYLWPLMPPARRDPDRSPHYAMFPYTICDSMVESLATKGVERRDLLDAYHSIDLSKRFPLERLRQINEAKSRQIDALSDFAITDQLFSGHAMRTANHPNGVLFAYMLLLVIERLPVDSAVVKDAARRAPLWAKGVGIQAVEAPVHPQVAQLFDLGWAKDRKWTFWTEGDFTFDEHLLRLYDRATLGVGDQAVAQRPQLVDQSVQGRAALRVHSGAPGGLGDSRLPSPQNLVGADLERRVGAVELR